MKKPEKLLRSMFFLAAGIALVGCNQEGELQENFESVNDDRISELIDHFYQKVHNTTRSAKHTFEITGISTQKYDVPDSIKAKTRTDLNESTYDIHTVTVDFGETTGYVILSDTPELDQIFYYTEEGCINDTTTNWGLKDVIESVPSIANAIMTGEISNNETTRSDEVNIDPIVPFRWTQADPFNNYATYCICDKCSERGNHMLLGCVAVAVGQTIATVGKFNGTFYGNRDIDFTKLRKTNFNVSQAEALALAHFMQEVALSCQTKFGCEKSGTSALAGAHCLLDNGYKCDYKTGGIDEPRFIMNLKEGLPHLVGGRRSGGGHMWIVDGIKYVNGIKYYHMNWGMGYLESDGWTPNYYYINTVSNDHYTKNHEHLYLGGIASK